MCATTDSGSEEVAISEQDDETNSKIYALRRADGAVWRKI